MTRKVGNAGTKNRPEVIEHVVHNGTDEPDDDGLPVKAALEPVLGGAILCQHFLGNHFLFLDEEVIYQHDSDKRNEDGADDGEEADEMTDEVGDQRDTGHNDAADADDLPGLRLGPDIDEGDGGGVEVHNIGGNGGQHDDEQRGNTKPQRKQHINRVGIAGGHIGDAAHEHEARSTGERTDEGAPAGGGLAFGVAGVVADHGTPREGVAGDDIKTGKQTDGGNGLVVGDAAPAVVLDDENGGNNCENSPAAERKHAAAR